MTFGVDYAWGRPGVTALRAAGVEFVCRYLSHDTTGKNLDPGEATSLSNAGIWLVVVWETTFDRALGGYADGVADAKAAASQAAACGMPGDRPIYFAVDFDAAPGDQAAINAYLDGADSVLGSDSAGRKRTGIYGGYGPVKRALDGNHAGWGWQTYAWSGGQWDPRAQLQQYSNDHTINGVGLDYDRPTKTDYGQWKVGVSPDVTPPSTQEDELPNGMLLNGSQSITPISIKRGAYKQIGFMADDGLQGLPIALVRVAVHDASGWHATTGVKISSTIGQTIINFPDPATTNGVSIQRSDAGQVNVAWEIS